VSGPDEPLRLRDAAVAEEPEDAATLRAEVRAWMAVHAAPHGPRRSPLEAPDTPEFTARARRWQATLDDGGWAVPGWPVEHGGRGLPGRLAAIAIEEQLPFEVPVGPFAVPVQMVGPTLLEHGTVAQAERYLPAIRRGEHIWCQLFSEPDAGSDLAGLRTRAVRVDGGWEVTGQKVWTSAAAHADRAILLARTVPGSWRHHGISYLVLDMHQPGVEVRPILQSNRNRHFNEVHLDGAYVPDEDLVGEEGEGWVVARTTLMAERTLIGGMSVMDRVALVAEEARRRGRLADPVVRQGVADAYARAFVLGVTNRRVEAALARGGVPGAEASVLKLALSLLMADLGELAMAVAGADGLLEGGERRWDPEDESTGNGYGPLQDALLGQWTSRIGGGTEQIQRNLVAERALGLPRDPRPPAPG
jgi:alkylation response protein AidB-like acyl-CoA dehydrogenase